MKWHGVLLLAAFVCSALLWLGRWELFAIVCFTGSILVDLFFLTNFFATVPVKSPSPTSDDSEGADSPE